MRKGFFEINKIPNLIKTNKKLRIANLYCGIGGNRKLWGNEHEIIAVELNPNIAKIYQDFFPNDKVIIADAHQYLLDHFKEFDFIWSSPPCQSHSKMNKLFTNGKAKNKIVYPDMKLYEEILFLKGYYKGHYVVENVKSWYAPLIFPQERGNHYFWSNFYIPNYDIKTRNHYGGIEKLTQFKQFNINNYKGIDKIKTLRNCVEPELGLHIFNSFIILLYKK